MHSEEDLAHSYERARISKKAQLALISLAAAGMAAGFFLIKPAAAQAAPEAAASTAPEGTFKPTEEQWNTLRLEKVQATDFRTEIVTDGYVAMNGDQTVPVFSPFTGRVSNVFAKAGDRVEKGAPLFSVAAEEFSQARNGWILAAQLLETAGADLDHAKSIYDRQKKLLDAQSGSVKDMEEARMALTNSESAHQAAAIALAGARHQLQALGISEEEIAALEQAKQVSQDAETTVTAPISGTITKRAVGVGQQIHGGDGGEVFTISDVSTVWLVANVRAGVAASIKPGLTLSAKIDSGSGLSLEGKAAYVSPAIDPDTMRLPVHAEVPNPDGALKPGMTAVVTIALDDAATHPAAPENAIIHEGDAARVWVKTGDTLSLRNVGLGRRKGGLTEVLSGLEAGDQIVTAGALFIDREAAPESGAGS